MKRRRKVAKNSFYYKDEDREIRFEMEDNISFRGGLANILEAEIIPPIEERAPVFSSSMFPGRRGAVEFGHKADEANTMLGASEDDLEKESEKDVRVPGYAGEPPDDIAYLKSPRVRGEGLPEPLDD
jgi:hypothetical protein